MLTYFVAAKLGESAETCEDVIRSVEGPGMLRIAICDGATMSSFARQWAILLAEEYARGRFPTEADIRRRTVPQGNAWKQYVFAKPLPWHAQEKASAGAFATLLVFGLHANRWRALAVGDTCLFHVRGNEVLSAFPVATASGFNNNPELLSSNEEANATAYDRVESASGTCKKGDLLVLATDGIAAWLLARHEAGRPPWAEFSKGADHLRALCDERRACREMKNDDVACAWIHV